MGSTDHQDPAQLEWSWVAHWHLANWCLSTGGNWLTCTQLSSSEANQQVRVVLHPKLHQQMLGLAWAKLTCELASSWLVLGLAWLGSAWLSHIAQEAIKFYAIQSLIAGNIFDRMMSPLYKHDPHYNSISLKMKPKISDYYVTAWAILGRWIQMQMAIPVVETLKQTVGIFHKC